MFAAGLALAPVGITKAWEVATNVPATAITAVPFVISTSGNYYLAANLTFTQGVGAAIVINADQVILDLNGKTLSSNAGTSFNVGIYVFNHKDVTIQEGDIDNFEFGVFFAPNSRDNNAKNTVDNVKFNGNGVGVYSQSGTSNWVKNSVIDGGDIGVFFQDDAGSRVSNCIFEDQTKTQQFGVGTAIVTVATRGTYFDNNLIEAGAGAFGQILGAADKYRFETFVGFAGNGSPRAGGINQLADSI